MRDPLPRATRRTARDSGPCLSSGMAAAAEIHQISHYPWYPRYPRLKPPGWRELRRHSRQGVCAKANVFSKGRDGCPQPSGCMNRPCVAPCHPLRGGPLGTAVPACRLRWRLSRRSLKSLIIHDIPAIPGQNLRECLAYRGYSRHCRGRNIHESSTMRPPMPPNGSEHKAGRITSARPIDLLIAGKTRFPIDRAQLRCYSP